MAGCNRTAVFDYGNFEGKDFEDMPKGDFLQIAVNPYNGRVFLKFNDYERWSGVINEIVDQLTHELRMMKCATGGNAGLSAFADVCDGKADRRDMRPSVVKMVHEGVYTQKAYLDKVG